MLGVFGQNAVVVQRLGVAGSQGDTTPHFDLTVGSLLWNTTWASGEEKGLSVGWSRSSAPTRAAQLAWSRGVPALQFC
jgi:hypothetical protein